jgi:predicted Zn-dependent protease
MAATKQLKNAQTSLSRAVSLMPDNIEAHSALADVLMQIGDFDGALSHFQKVMALAPQNLEVHIKAAHAYTLQANPRGALETLKKVATKYYDNPVVQKEIGLAEFQTGDTSSAKRDLNRYLQSGEPDLKVLIVLGRIHAGLGEYEEALEMFENAYPLDDNKAAAKQRIDAVKAKIQTEGPGRSRPKSPFEDANLKPKKKFPLKLTVRIGSAAVAAIGLAGGFFFNSKVAGQQFDYDNAKSKKTATEIGDEMRKNEKMRNMLYMVGLAGGAVCGISFVIPFGK